MSIANLGITIDDIIFLRNSYSYPASHIAISQGHGDYALADDFYLCFRPARDGETQSSKSLDQHHFRLLNSHSNYEVIAGIASVIYWGFFSSANGRQNDGRARSRARFFLEGRKNSRHRLESQDIVERIKSARQLLEQKRFGRALKAVSAIQELGQVSFASKVITFLNSNSAAVFDSIISNKISNMPSFSHLSMNVNQGGVTKPKQEKYQIWCEFCSGIASSLNQDTDSGKSRKWIDWDGSRHNWRAVDVERAIFASKP